MRKGYALGLAPLVLASCVGNAASTQVDPSNNAAVCQAYDAGRSHVEVVSQGHVTRIFGVRPGRRDPHEGFLIALDNGCSLIVRVETNVDMTGPVPLQQGEDVVVKGEYEYYPKGGVIHWTHHANGGSHPGGYVESNGKIYQ